MPFDVMDAEGLPLELEALSAGPWQGYGAKNAAESHLALHNTISQACVEYDSNLENYIHPAGKKNETEDEDDAAPAGLFDE